MKGLVMMVRVRRSLAAGLLGLTVSLMSQGVATTSAQGGEPPDYGEGRGVTASRLPNTGGGPGQSTVPWALIGTISALGIGGAGLTWRRARKAGRSA